MFNFYVLKCKRVKNFMFLLLFVPLNILCVYIAHWRLSPIVGLFLNKMQEEVRPNQLHGFIGTTDRLSEHCDTVNRLSMWLSFLLKVAFLIHWQ